MINYEEELKKFEPCQDVDDAENAIYRQDLNRMWRNLTVNDTYEPGSTPNMRVFEKYADAM